MAPVATSATPLDASSASNGGAAAAPSTPSAAAASLTSHEEAQARYTALKAQIQETLRKKRNIDRTLSDLESQIWLFEGSYFTSTAASGGNIVKGFENYLKGGPAGASSGASADAVANEDRVFSASSLTYQRSLELKAAEELMKQQQEAQKKESSSKKDKEKDKEKDKDKDKDEGGGSGSKKDKDKSSHKRRREE